jgi:hypothetical protein
MRRGHRLDLILGQDFQIFGLEIPLLSDLTLIRRVTSGVMIEGIEQKPFH